MWIQRLLTSFEKLDLTKSTEIKCDNQGAIHLARNPTHHKRSKHVDIQYHYVRKKIEDGEINLEYISTTTMAADGLTKPLGKPKWVSLQSALDTTIDQISNVIVARNR